MHSMNLFSRKTKLFLASFAVLAVLLTSGAVTTSAFSLSSSSSSVKTSTQLGAPSHATYSGPVSKFLLGPYRTTPVLGSFATTMNVANQKFQSGPNLNPRPATVHAVAGVDMSAASTTVPPVVNCLTASSMCASIINNKLWAKTTPGVNAVDSGASYGQDVEPPDQSVCVGNGYVMQAENIGELQVYSTGLAPQSGIITLDSLMGLTTIPASMGGPWSSGGDVSCLYDYGNGGHWFVTEFVSNSSEASGGTFSGCFAAKLMGCFEGIAVSITNNPLGAYNVYFLNPNLVNNDPGAGYLLNDFAKIGNTQDAFLLSYDEFNLNSATVPACPAFGCFGFNGAQQFAFNKNALEEGFPVTEPNNTPDPYFNVAYVNMGNSPGLYPIPANSPFQPASASCFQGTYAGFVCWYQAIPAMSPDPTQFDNNNGGTGFVVAGLDFFGLGDNREAVFAWTDLSALNSNTCSLCGNIGFSGQIFNNVNSYIDEGLSCLVENGGTCGLGQQKVGDIPLGNNCAALGLNASDVPNGCPESGIASNFDGVTQVSYAGGNIWFGISTLISQTLSSGSQTHLGIAYYVVGTSQFVGATPTFTLTDQAYVTAMNADLEFPAIAATDGNLALLTFTINGANYYPSTGFGIMTTSSHGLLASKMFIADLGQSPQDGFTEYLGYSTANNGLSTRPRWGDYSAAIYEPMKPGSTTGAIYFATEFINAPPCSSSQFQQDTSCGMTRDPFANWDNSINSLSV